MQCCAQRAVQLNEHLLLIASAQMDAQFGRSQAPALFNAGASWLLAKAGTAWAAAVKMQNKTRFSALALVYIAFAAAAINT